MDMIRDEHCHMLPDGPRLGASVASSECTKCGNSNLSATIPLEMLELTVAGSSLGAYGLPLNGGASSKTGQLSSFVSAFSAIYSAKPGDLTTLTDIQNSLDA